MITETVLSQPDKDITWTVQWHAKQIAARLENGVSVKEAQEIADDLTDIETLMVELRDTTTPTHIDKDILPNPAAPIPTPALIGEAKPGARRLTFGLFVGHTKNTGAQSAIGTDEWTTRNGIAKRAAAILRAAGHSCHIFYRDGRVGYTAAMRKHGQTAKKHNLDASMELHWNAANKTAKGGFLLVGSRRTADSLGKCYGHQMAKKFPDRTRRGDNGVVYKQGGRGWQFNRFQPCPSGISELFFADTPSEIALFDEPDEMEAEAQFVAGVFLRFAKRQA